MRRPLVMITNCVLAAAASAALAITAAAASSAGVVAAPGFCHAVQIPVSLPAGNAASGWLRHGDVARGRLIQGDAANAAGQAVWAELCTPYRAAPGRPVDVTVPGATYTHLYWDWPVDPGLYNFTAKALRAGQAVLDYDRLGTGESTSPPAADLTVGSDAAVLHQVIAWIRGHAGYNDVNVIGHSLGSAIALQEAGTWPGDASRLVLTGILNQVSTAAAAALAADLYPAASDPQFPDAGPGYLTTVPGVRGSLFYSAAASPAVIAYDEARKSVVSESEASSAMASLNAPPAANVSDEVRAPVLIVDGEDDALFCVGSIDCANPASVTQFERPYFCDAASLTVRMVPDTGHDVALHPTASESFAMITAWLRSTPAGGSPGGGTRPVLRSAAVHNLPGMDCDTHTSRTSGTTKASARSLLTAQLPAARIRHDPQPGTDCGHAGQQAAGR